MNDVVIALEREELSSAYESRLGTFPVVFESRKCTATHKVQIGKSGSFEALAHDSEVIQVQFFFGLLHELYAHVAGFHRKKFYFGHYDRERENRATCTGSHVGPFFRRENARRLATD